MIKQIKLKFDNQQTIVINLLDIPVVQRWANFAKNLDFISSDIIPQPQLEITKLINLTEKWQRLVNAVDLMKTKYKINSEVLSMPSQWNHDQQLLNRLHRFFTYHCELTNKKLSVPSKYDPSFQTPDEDKKIRELFFDIDEINDAVHKLETSSIPEYTCQYFIDNNLSCNSLIIDQVISRDQYCADIPKIDFTEEEIKHNYNFDLTKEKEFPVVLGRNILGKCVMQSFFENDDPTEFDCTGRIGSFGSFFIDLDWNRKKIYQTSMFNDWCLRWNLDINNLPLEFQIGWVESFSIDPTNFLDNNLKLDTIEFQ